MADYSWTEPVSNYKTKYPYNNVTETESGHFQEWDDTPGAERIRTQHRSGTFQEIQSDGSVVNKILGKNYTIVAKDNNVLISGVCNITINGDSVLNVSGDCYQQIKGNFNQVVEGDYNLLVKGALTLNGGTETNIGTLATGGDVNIQASDRLVLQSDLTVHGEVLADSLYSNGSVTAGTGIHAGVPGSLNPVAGISTLGGINVGIPGPTIPGVMFANVMVNTPISIAYVMSYGTTVMDPTGGLPLVRTIYDSHNHIAPYGPTSPPLQPMPLP